MTLKPLSDRVLFEEIVLEQVSEGGIIIAADSSMLNDNLELLTGKVIAVGEGKIIEGGGLPIKPEVKVGDLILYNPRQALKFTYSGKEYLSLRASEIPYKLG
jgi:co-chaperonin GroES (HSP10)